LLSIRKQWSKADNMAVRKMLNIVTLQVQQNISICNKG